MALTLIGKEQIDALVEVQEVHVWTVTVSEWLPQLALLGESLNPAERERAARFRFERDRRRFTLCRGLLRAQLGNYLSVEPGDIEFRFGAHDKPEIASSNRSRIEFNLSHADEAAYFAFSTGKRLGVDIERMRPESDVLGLGRQVYTAKELDRLSTAPEQQQLDLFFEMWTQKEAYIKAVGLGLSAPVREITVANSLIPQGDEPGIGLVEGYGVCWSLLSLPAPTGYKAALAVEGRITRDRVQVMPLRPPN